MLAYFLHLFAASDPEGVDNWVNILFVAIFIIFWVVSALLRGKARQAEKKENFVPQSKDKSKLSDKSLIEKMLGEVLGEPPEQVTFKPRTQKPTPQKLSVYKNRLKVLPQQEKFSKTIASDVIPNKLIPDKVLPELSVPDVLKETEDLQFSQENFKLELSPVYETKRFQDTYTSALLFSQLLESNREELKKAILYYEILGKPLSLREPPGFLF